MDREQAEAEMDIDGDNQSSVTLTTNFLFGNVNRRGELEDFEGDEEERRAINQLGRCQVTELNETVHNMIDDSSAATPIDGEGDVSSLVAEKERLSPVVEAEDYYDCSETIADEEEEVKEEISEVEINLASLTAATELDKKQEDYDDDYDEPEPIKQENTSTTSSSPIKDDIKEKPQLLHPSLPSEDTKKISEPLLPVDTDSTDEKHQVPPALSIKEELKSTSMPPPSWLPPESSLPRSAVITSSPVKQMPGVSNETEQATALTITTESSDTNSNHVSSQPEGGATTPALNTPLGNMMPPEYAAVDIRSLFPEYDPQKTPRWSKLFRPVHPIALYKACEEGPLPEDPLWTDDREHIFYEGLDLGRIPETNEILPDDIHELRRVEDSAVGGAASGYSGDKSAAGQASDKAEQDGKTISDKTPTWRNGPAKLWYDMLGLPKSADITRFPLVASLANRAATVDSGNSLDQTAKNQKADVVHTKQNGDSMDVDSSDEKSKWESKKSMLEIRISAEALLPVNQVAWEDDIIWDSQASQSKIQASLRANASYAGWFPTNLYRTMAKFQDAHYNKYPGIFPSQATGSSTDRADPNTWRSIFPVENEALISGEWEQDIIWDATNKPPPPSLLTLDRNDETLILDFPQEEAEVWDEGGVAGGEAKGKMMPPATRPFPGGRMGKVPRDKESSKAKLILGRHGLLKEDDEADDYEDEEEEAFLTPAKKDPFNLSNDEFYYPRLISSMTRQGVGGAGGGSLASGGPIQHSTPAMELRAPFFPPHMGPQRLRFFHRPQLKRYNRGSLALYNSPHPVCNLAKNIRKKIKQREDERAACGGGEIFFMRTPADLSAMDGELILAEYSEEFPPLMMQVGMATRMLNYYKRPSSKEAGSETAPPHLPYGDLVYAHQSPFLGQIRPGQCQQAFETNMFRSPIYTHRTEPADFILIRNRNGYYIRRINDIFTVGQLCPLMEVPGPNSKKANNFVRDSLQVYIYRLFWKSEDEPRRIKIEDVRKAFPNHSESSVRKRLKLCADFKRTGQDASWWVLRPDFRLPTEEELRAMVSPEDCCSYYSMQAAEQRLKDAGYGEKFIFVPGDQEEDEDKESQVKMSDEVRAAPWNTTHSYLSAMRGKCLLELHGAADPTGCGEAFSYAKISAKPGSLLRDGPDGVTEAGLLGDVSGGGLEAGSAPGKRMVTGTDADLRKLHLRDAKVMLRNCGVPENEIKKLKRWEIIDLVRTMSNQKAKQGEEEGMAKFARGSRLSTAEQLDRYREECQRIFDLQTRVLSSVEVLSTDDASTSEEEDGECDLEEEGRNINAVLANKLTSGQLRARKEELERRQLHKKIYAGEDLMLGKKNRRKPGKSDSCTAISGVGDEDQGGPSTGIGLDTSDGGGRNRALHISRTYLSEDGKQYTRTEVVPWGPVVEIYLHIRQNQNESFIREFVGSDEQVKEERRKEKRRQQDKLRRIKKIEAQQGGRSGKERGYCLGRSSQHSGHSRHNRNSASSAADAARKKRAKPMTPALSKMRCGACGQTGHMRTNKECPRYGQPDAVADRPPKKERIGSSKRLEPTPSGLTVSELLAGNRAREFGDSSDQFPFEDSELTKVEGTKLKMSTGVLRFLEEKNRNDLKLTIPKRMLNDLVHQQEQIDRREKLAKGRKTKGKALGPGGTAANRVAQQRGDYNTSAKNRGNRRRIDPKVALNHLFEGVYKGIQTITGYKHFLHPVKEKDFPTYRSLINNPMDLSIIRQKTHDNTYSTREEFLADVQLIHVNSAKFNGEFSEYTEIATRICSYVLEEFCTKERKLMRLERLVNPLLDENDLVGFNFVLQKAVDAMQKVEHSRAFHQPVDKKKYKDYYTRIERPMDLKTLESKVKLAKYRSRDEFLNDVELILKNCITYNGETNPLTKIAQQLFDVAKEKLRENESCLEEYELNIRSHTEELSVTGMDTDSVAGRSVANTDLQSQIDDQQTPATPLQLSQPPSFSLGGRRTSMAELDLELSEPDEEKYQEEEEEEDTVGLPPAKRLRLMEEDKERSLAKDLRLSDSDNEDDDGGGGVEETTIYTADASDTLMDLYKEEDEEDADGPSSPVLMETSGDLENDLVMTDTDDDDDEDEMMPDDEEEGGNMSGDLVLSEDDVGEDCTGGVIVDEDSRSNMIMPDSNRCVNTSKDEEDSRNSPVHFYLGESVDDDTQDLAEHF